MLPSRAFALYFAICLGALGFDIGLLLLLVEAAGVPYLLANAVSFLAGSAVAYFACMRWVFVAGAGAARFGLFTAVGGVALALNSAVLWGLTEGLGVLYAVSKIAAAGASFLGGYLLRRLVFAR